jgi:hypothetical protein
MCFYLQQSARPGGVVRCSFEKLIILMTYGDDAKSGSKVDWFTQKTFIRSARWLGVHATPANKSADAIDFSHFDGEEFLHRTWRYDEEWGVWCAPLCLDSVARSLTINVKSGMGVVLQTALSAQSANLEFAMHGRRTFEKLMGELRILLVESGVPCLTFKSYNEVMTNFYGEKPVGVAPPRTDQVHM